MESSRLLCASLTSSMGVSFSTFASPSAILPLNLCAWRTTLSLFCVPSVLCGRYGVLVALVLMNLNAWCWVCVGGSLGCLAVTNTGLVGGTLGRDLRERERAFEDESDAVSP